MAGTRIWPRLRVAPSSLTRPALGLFSSQPWAARLVSAAGALAFEQHAVAANDRAARDRRRAPSHRFGRSHQGPGNLLITAVATPAMRTLISLHRSRGATASAASRATTTARRRSPDAYMVVHFADDRCPWSWASSQTSYRRRRLATTESGHAPTHGSLIEPPEPATGLTASEACPVQRVLPRSTSGTRRARQCSPSRRSIRRG